MILKCMIGSSFIKISMIICLQCAVLSVLGGISSVGQVTNHTLDMLASAKVQLKKLLVSLSVMFACLILL